MCDCAAGERCSPLRRCAEIFMCPRVRILYPPLHLRGEGDREGDRGVVGSIPYELPDTAARRVDPSAVYRPLSSIHSVGRSSSSLSLTSLRILIGIRKRSRAIREKSGISCSFGNGFLTDIVSPPHNIPEYGLLSLYCKNIAIVNPYSGKTESNCRYHYSNP